MKILVIGLDGLASELLLSDARLENLRRLIEFGCYGKLSYEGTTDRMGLWMSLVAGQDIGPLGEAVPEDLKTIQGMTLWKQMEEQNKGVIVVGPHPFISYPIEVKTRVDDSLLNLRLLGEKLTFRDTDQLKDHIFTVSHKQLDLVRLLMQSEEWHYFQFVDDGVYQIQKSEISQSDSDVQELLEEYYLHVDRGVGAILEFLDDNTIVLVIFLHATEPFEGSFILSSSNNPLTGEVEGAHLLDLVPTLLELGGYNAPDTMQGKSLVAGKVPEVKCNMDLSAEEDEILRERLSGLGYLS